MTLIRVNSDKIYTPEAYELLIKRMSQEEYNNHVVEFLIIHENDEVTAITEMEER